MDLTPSRQQERIKVAEQAEEWLIALEEGETDPHGALTDWLAESPLHVEMFLRATATRRLAATLDTEQRRRIMAHGDSSSANVVPLEARPAAPAMPDKPRRGVRPFELAASLTAAIAAAVGFYALQTGHRYDTAVGEQRSLNMPDGSVIHLNTASQLTVDYSHDARDIRLNQGEALFKVQPDPARPFRVHIGNDVVQAVGTQFNIHRQDNSATVSVIEGVVAINSTTRLTAGQAAMLSGGHVEEQMTADVTQVTAWRQRQLIFERAPLAEIVEEFNRYNASPRIRIETPELREWRYTAVFDADAPGELLKFLDQDGRVEVTRSGETEVAIRKRRTLSN